MGCKFEYVVTPQTYGKNRASKDLRMRWLAQSMDIMMQKYPRLKARSARSHARVHACTHARCGARTARACLPACLCVL